uniref:Uncharacterized protein n=1 Tax=Anguilla anguilla TaxID=7936 RepID=A0A0E9QD58_ANGAN
MGGVTPSPALPQPAVSIIPQCDGTLKPKSKSLQGGIFKLALIIN